MKGEGTVGVPFGFGSSRPCRHVSPPHSRSANPPTQLTELRRQETFASEKGSAETGHLQGPGGLGKNQLGLGRLTPRRGCR